MSCWVKVKLQSIMDGGELWLFCPLPFHPLACSHPDSFARWLIRPPSPSGWFAPHPGWFAPSPRWIYRWFVIEACVSIYRKATSKLVLSHHWLIVTSINVIHDKLLTKSVIFGFTAAAQLLYICVNDDLPLKWIRTGILGSRPNNCSTNAECLDL